MGGGTSMAPNSKKEGASAPLYIRTMSKKVGGTGFKKALDKLKKRW